MIKYYAAASASYAMIAMTMAESADAEERASKMIQLMNALQY